VLLESGLVPQVHLLPLRRTNRQSPTRLQLAAAMLDLATEGEDDDDDENDNTMYTCPSLLIQYCQCVLSAFVTAATAAPAA
jgi:hypothetical protein